MNSFKKSFTTQFITAIVGVGIVLDALNKLFVGQASELTFRYYEYGLLEWMIPLAWLQLVAGVIYLNGKTRSVGFWLLLAGIVATGFVRLQNGDGVFWQVAILMGTSMVKVLDGKYHFRKMRTTVLNQLYKFPLMKRHFGC